MSNVIFEDLWQLLAPEGEFCRRRKACEKLWQSFNMERQLLIYNRLQTKKSNGEYVSPNPYYAIDDNDRPAFLTGMEQDRAHAAGIALVLVRYGGRFLVCSEETSKAYGLTMVRKA